MADVASLVVKVSEQGAKATSDRLDNLSKSAKVAGAAVAGLASIVAATAYKAAQELVDSNGNWTRCPQPENTNRKHAGCKTGVKHPARLRARHSVWP